MTFLRSLFLCLLVFILTFSTIYFYFESKIVNTGGFIYQHKGNEISGKEKRESPILIYNRVPKTGSTSLMNVAYELYSQNQFRVVQIRVTQYKHILTLSDQMSLVSNMSGWSNTPSLYHGHFAYFPLSRLGGHLNTRSSVFWINLVRKPLDRLVSHYYFLRYGDDVLTSKVRAKEGDTTTFDSCVEKAGPDCDPRKLWLQVPFFCGHSPQCWEAGSEWALGQAKANLVSQYLVVGVTEDLDSLVQVLEILLPQFFKGGSHFLTESGKSHIKKTRHKDEISPETIEKLKSSKIWKMEDNFYNFALKHFQNIKKTVLDQKKSGKETFFNFEKVRPR